MSKNYQGNKYPVTQSQLGVILEWIQHPETTQGTVNFEIVVPLALDEDRLFAAMQQTLSAHDCFFTRFTLVDGAFYQYTDRSTPLSIQRCTMPENEVAAFMESIIRPLDLLNEALFSAYLVTTEQAMHIIYLTTHAITDGASSMLLASELNEHYLGHTPPVPDIPFQRVVEREQYELQSAAYLQAKEYCKATFASTPITQLARQKHEGLGALRRIHYAMPSDDVMRFSADTGIRPNRLFMAAFAMALQVFSGEEVVAFDALYHGRANEAEHQMQGMFIRNVPVKADFSSATTTLRDVLRGFDDNFRGNPHGIYPFTHFCNDLNNTARCSYDYVMHHCFVELDGHQCPIYDRWTGQFSDGTSLMIYQEDDTFLIYVEYNEARCQAAYALQFMHTLITLVQQFLQAGPDAPLGSLAWMSDAEQAQLLTLGQGESLPDEPRTITQLIDAQADAHPHNIAIVDEAGCITYAQLRALSDRFALWLQQQGVEPGQHIALLLPRRKEFVIAALGAMKVGVAYIPIDPAYPAERIEYMMHNSQARLQLSQPDIEQALTSPTETSKPRNIETSKYRNIETSKSRNLEISKPRNLETSNNRNLDNSIIRIPDNSTPLLPAYLIYTSGSTGQPKGVCISQKALTSFARTCVHTYQLTSADRILCQATFSFDASVEDIYPILSVGGQLHIMPESGVRDLTAIARYIQHEGITGSNFTTQLGLLLLSKYPQLPLRYVTVGGERLNTLPQGLACRFFNSYGPTEFTVDATFWEATPGAHPTDIPIGRPVCNAQCYVLDSQHRLVPRGCDGELYLAGYQIADGYLGLADDTARHFLPNPFSTQYATMYATGDVVRWDEDGNLLYMGRKDGQVKLRGFRIEMGEINTQLMRFPGIEGAHTAVVRQGHREVLCAWYLAHEPVDETALQRFLSHKLPTFMVPDVWIPVSQFAYLPNGKVDVHSLPQPNDIATKSELVMPESMREIILLRIARKVLGTDDFGVTDRLRDVGMTSMLSMQFCAEAQEQHIMVKVSDVMSNKTIRSLSCSISTVVSWYQPYRPGKPIIAYIAGALATHYNEPRLQRLSPHFNILYIEPIEEHYGFIFADKGTYQSICLLYYALLDAYLPQGETLTAFMGISIGGSMALTLAQLYHEDTGVMASVVIGDSLTAYDTEEIHEGEVRDEEMQFALSVMRDIYATRRAEFADEAAYEAFLCSEAQVFVYRQRIADKVSSAHQSQPLACRALLINTTAEKPASLLPQQWRPLVASLQVLDIPATHNNMSVDVSGEYLTPMCDAIIRFLS